MKKEKRNNEFCRSCVWHSNPDGFVCCDYSLVEGHEKRACKAGVGCRYHKTEKEKRNQTARRDYANMEFCDRNVYRTLVEIIGKKRLAEISGYSMSGLGSAKVHERIRRDAAEKILAETGLDITGGALRHG